MFGVKELKKRIEDLECQVYDLERRKDSREDTITVFSQLYYELCTYPLLFLEKRKENKKEIPVTDAISMIMDHLGIKFEYNPPSKTGGDAKIVTANPDTVKVGNIPDVCMCSGSKAKSKKKK